VSLPGTNEANENLAEAIKEIDEKHNIGGEDVDSEEQKNLEFSPPLYF
jgi:hypothetical protein